MDFEHVIHYKELLLCGKTGPRQGKYVSKYHARSGRRSAALYRLGKNACLPTCASLPSGNFLIHMGQSSGHWQRICECQCPSMAAFPKTSHHLSRPTHKTCGGSSPRGNSKRVNRCPSQMFMKLCQSRLNSLILKLSAALQQVQSGAA